MKRFLIIIFSFLVGVTFSYAFDGVWSGQIEVQGVKLPLVFHFDAGNPTIDSPSQGAKGIPMRFKMMEPDSIAVNVSVIGASFCGKAVGDRIEGVFSQRGIELPLILWRGESGSYRPQTPQPPFPYKQEEVSFSNGDANLRGTLTLPEGWCRQTPVVIMVTGSGLQNRDEEILDHKPFAVISDALAKAGIASLRYDDRGFGQSTGDAVNCTTEDLKNDALAGIELLRQRFDKVGVLGHSEGGTVALMLGADHKCDFIVSLAGMIISGAETLLEQNRYMLAAAGYPQQTVDEYCELMSLAFEGNESLASRLSASALPMELKQNMQAGLGQLKTPYMQYFLTLDLRNRLRDVTCPTLALNGTKDTQVFHLNNLMALRDGLPSNEMNKVMAMDGLNHLFQHCSTGMVTEYATIEETISPEVTEIISQWINQVNE